MCLDNLYKQKNFREQYNLEVFLVDDGSTDGTSAAVMEKFPDVKIIRGTGNLYWNRGMRLAWSEAAKEDFDYYLWLNDDTMLFETALADMLNCASITNEKALICGTTKSAINGTITYGGRSKTKGLLEPNNQLQQCDYFNGNCVLVPRDVYKVVGNLDYIFSHSTGDWDYGLRAAKAGIKSFISFYYIGTCEKHDSLPKWCSPSIRLKDRIKAFQTPLAVNPVQHFQFDLRHNGLFAAVKHFITIHIRLFFPSLWVRKP
jgi:GT2 family glycosyltransferase